MLNKAEMENVVELIVEGSTQSYHYTDNPVTVYNSARITGDIRVSLDIDRQEQLHPRNNTVLDSCVVDCVLRAESEDCNITTHKDFAPIKIISEYDNITNELETYTDFRITVTTKTLYQSITVIIRALCKAGLYCNRDCDGKVHMVLLVLAKIRYNAGDYLSIQRSCEYNSIVSSV